MSNPFKLIRRYQKQMMVVFGVVLMASFGLGTVLSTVGNRAGDGRGGRSAATLVKWRGGSLTDAEIDVFRQHHFQTQAFLGEVLRLGADENMTLKVPFRLMPIVSEDQSREYADRSTVDLMMFAEKAKQDGFVVGDIAVDQYLTLLGNNKVEPEEYSAILKKISDHFSVQQLKDHLKLELAALNYDLALRSGLGGARPIDLMERQGSILQNAAIDPVEAWEAFDRLNRKATCEVLEIDVKEFVDEVDAEPAKAEIKKIYEEGKGDFADPAHEKPGFKIANQAKIGVFEINRNTIVRREQEKISDEEIQRVYDEWVANKDKRVIDTAAAEEDEDEEKQPPLIPPAEESTEKKEESDSPDAQEDAAPESTEKKDAVEKGESGEPKNEPEKSSESQPKPEDADPEKSPDQPKAKSDGEDAGPSKDGSKESDGECGLNLSPQNQEKSANPDEDSDEKSADEKPADEKPESKTESPDGDAKKSEESKSPEDASAQTPEQPNAEKTEQPSTIPPEGVAQPEVKIRPLDEKLRQEIKSSLVDFAKVEETMEAMQAACAEAIDNYYVDLEAWKSAEASGEKEEEPVMPDFDAVAKAFGARYEETAELLTEEEFLDHPLGRETLFIMQQSPSGQPDFQQPPLAQLAFNRYERGSLFQRFDGRSFDGRTYLIWFIEKVDAHIPKLDECRPQVIEYWQYQEGLAAARQEAEKIAKEMEEKKQMLTAAYPSKAESTGQFTWMSSNRLERNAPPDITPVSGVSNAGEEFMKTAFSLNPGDVGVAANASNDKVYVIQLTDIDEQEDVLQEQFFRTPALGSQASLASILKVERMMQEIREQIAEEMDVQWVDAKKN